MNIKQHLYNFLKLIPEGKVVSYGVLANIFCVSPREIGILVSENTEQDLYPCYKVVNADGSIGGYNLGVENKTKRLLTDGVEIVNDFIKQECFWKPRLRNMFVGFPLEGKELNKYEEVIEDTKQHVPASDLEAAEVKFQDPATTHITLRFFGDIHIKEFQRLVHESDEKKIKLAALLPKKDVFLDTFDNFGERVWFFGSKDEKQAKTLSSFYNEFHRLMDFPVEPRDYHAHLTLYRMRNAQKEVIEKLLDFLEGISFSINLNKITRYAAIDQHFQVPLIDIKLK